ncbi:MAG: hypothetical protein NZ529_01895 [Cytophagaceae bacterium]|nr:hypothetical protein [Cytophagaceae bacterium]MDW8455520.1 hypothetical protein [Cytophagaceae bacterium]
MKTSVPFSVSTPYLEPDGRKLILPLPDYTFVALQKTKGGLNGESEYILEKFDKELVSIFKTNLICSQDEDYKDLFFNDKDIILFSVVHNTDDRKAILKAYFFDVITGIKKHEKTLHEHTVKEWLDHPGKGVVKETFINAICSSVSKNFVTPLEYQYEIRYSPNKSKILAYIFDYSHKTLFAHGYVFDKHLNPLHHGHIPIDNGFVNYGIEINNREDIFILNQDRSGRIVVIQYHLHHRHNKLLDIQNANSNRGSLVLQVLSDDVVYIACTNQDNGKMTGIMYAKLDFKQLIVDRINSHELSVNIIQTAQTMRASNKFLAGEENWMNYEIVFFQVNEYEKIIIALEKRELISPGYAYNANNFNHPKNWSERLIKVNTEGILLFSFNKNDELLWENFYQKSQVNDVSAGITGSSFSLHITADGRIRAVFPTYNNNSFIYNIYNFVEWDELTGNKVKDLAAPNDEAFSMITCYTMWWEDRVIIAGRKGIFGKKSTLNLYQLEVN